jgi:hypothetical protein
VEANAWDVEITNADDGPEPELYTVRVSMAK